MNINLIFLDMNCLILNIHYKLISNYTYNKFKLVFKLIIQKCINQQIITVFKKCRNGMFILHFRVIN